jgi:hypothetical protein
LIPQIKKILPEHIKIIPGIAKQTQKYYETKVGFSTAENNNLFLYE